MVSALPRLVLTIVLSLLSLSLLASAAVVSNGGFESGSSGWTLRNTQSGTVVVSEANCDSGACLRLPASIGSLVGSADQVITLLPGPYDLSFRFKALPSASSTRVSSGVTSIIDKTVLAYAVVTDESWNRTCFTKPGKQLTILSSIGSGAWQTRRNVFFYPAADDCGESTAQHQVRLSVNSSATSVTQDNLGAMSIYLDDVSVAPLAMAPPSPPSMENLELGAWYGNCASVNTSQVPYACPATALPTPVEIDGRQAVRLQGNGSLSSNFRLPVRVTPLTTYLIRVNYSITDRRCLNYIGTGYTNLALANGIGCGELSFTINESGAAPAMRPPAQVAIDKIVNGVYPLVFFSSGYSVDSPIPASDRDWFEESYYYKTSNETYYLWFDFASKGFDGKLYISNLSLVEAATVAPDEAIEVPINNEFAGMKIKSFTASPLSVETAVSRFDFSSNQITMTRGGEAGRLTFPDGFLAGLSRVNSGLKGIVVIENANAKFVVGADSSLIVRLKQRASIVLSGPAADYSWFESGVVFETDWRKGILFTQIKPDNLALVLPRTHDPWTDEITYDKPISDLYMQSHGALNWRVEKNFSTNGIVGDWRVRYDFAPGDAFLASVFPPKDYNETAFCKTRSGTAANSQLRDYDLSPYYFQSFTRTHSVLRLWINGFDQSDNRQPIPFVVRNNSAPGAPAPLIPQSACTLNITYPLTNVSCAEYYQSKNTQYIPSSQDEFSSQGGPYAVAPQRLPAFKRAVAAAHDAGAKVTIYTTPAYYYTWSPDAFVADLAAFSATTGADGFYWDGYTQGLLRSLKLVRLFRNSMPAAHLTIHSSQNTGGVLPRTDNFRNPLLDAYADDLLVGESTEFGDDTSWKLVFCQRGISNTVTAESTELRPINLSLSWEENLPTMLDVIKQGDKSLACGGQIRFWPFPTKVINMGDAAFSGKTLPSDYRPYLQSYGVKCLPVTCGDSFCDSYESVFNCPRDCAPPLPTSSSINNLDVAQWLTPNGPLYAMHFSFDGDLVRDDSGNKLPIDERLGGLIPAPEPTVVDGHRAYWFNGTESVPGQFFESLDFAGRDVSIFTNVKFAAANISDGATLYRFINGSAGLAAMMLKKNSTGVFARAFVNSTNNRLVYLESPALADGWHSLGTVFAAASGALTLYADGAPVATASVPEGLQGGSGVFSGYYTVSAESNAPVSFKGWDGTRIYYYYRASIKKPFVGFMDDLLVSMTAFTPEMARKYDADQGRSFGTAGWTPILLDSQGKARSLPSGWVAPVTVNLQLAAGWNLASVPLTDASVTSTCGDTYAYAYSPQSRAYQSRTLGQLPDLQGRGAWVYVRNACQISFIGQPAALSPVVGTGWNILDGAVVKSPPVGCSARPTAFRYDNSQNAYTTVPSNQAQSGTAYWIRLDCSQLAS